MPSTNKGQLLIRGKEKYKGLPRWAKVIIIALMSFLILLVIGWFVLSWYINHHKKEILVKITTAVSESMEGNFHIDDIEPALLQSFPSISVRLKGVTLSDSLYYKHKKNTLEFGSVYISLNVFSLITKHPEINKVTIEDGTVYLFHNKYNYGNTYLFNAKKKQGNKGSGKQPDINKFGIENVLFVYDFFDRDKQFKIGISNIQGDIHRDGNIWNIKADTRVHFYQMAFNLEKGGFLKSKDLEGDLDITFNTLTKSLQLPKQYIKVNGTKIKAGVVFNFGAKPIDYSFDIEAPSIGFKEGVSYLSDTIASRLDSFDFDKNISVKVLLHGSFQYPDTPLVHAYFQTENNELRTSYGKFMDTKLKGNFSNYAYKGRGRGDDNSAVTITGFTGSIMEIPVVMDTFVLYGLINPFITIRMKSKFDVKNVNSLIGNTFTFESGTADLNIKYDGPVASTDNFQHTLYGHIIVKDAAFTYAPRNLKFKKCNINIDFLGQDLLLNNTSLFTKNSAFNIQGVAHNFLNVYLLDPGKVAFVWNFNSSHIDLNDFKSFLAPKVKSSSQKQNNDKTAKISQGFSTMLQQSNMQLHVNVKQLQYNHFSAGNILGDVTLTENEMSFKNISLNHSGGSLSANVITNTSGNLTPFQLQGTINNVKIDKLFYAFDNFGQTTLSPQNLAGSLSANINVKGLLNADGSLRQRSMVGKVSFALKNGELNNFKPLETIQKFIFKKRNLSHVTFNELKNDLEIYDGKIKINPMTILSSAAIIRMEGVYAFQRGTDISIVLPLRNPEKDKELIAQGKVPKFNKGIVLYLRARDDDAGNVKISWDPLKKGLSNEQTKDANASDDDVHQE
jgi:hypothetical protein